MKVYRIRQNAKIPVRAHSVDAGMDLFYCPNFTEKNCGVASKGNGFEISDKGVLTLYKRSSVLIPTGLKFDVPRGYMLEIKNKSGIAYKEQLLVGSCVVDPGYFGEVYVNLHHIAPDGCARTILPGQKIAQAVLIPIAYPTLEEVFEDISGSPRGDGAFGSTGVV